MLVVAGLAHGLIFFETIDQVLKLEVVIEDLLAYAADWSERAAQEIGHSLHVVKQLWECQLQLINEHSVEGFKPFFLAKGAH